MNVKEIKTHNENKNYINILQLPNVLKLEIFKYLSVNDIGSCAKTCKDFNAIIIKGKSLTGKSLEVYTETLWKHIYSRLNPDIKSPSEYAYLESCKNFINYKNNVKEGKYTYQVLLNEEGTTIWVKDRCVYQRFKGNKVEISGTVLGESDILDLGKHENFVFVWANRLLTSNAPSTPQEVQTTKLWNTKTKVVIKEFYYSSKSKILESNENCIATISEDGKINIINIKLEKQFQIDNKKEITWSLLKGNFLEIISLDRKIMIIDITTGELTHIDCDPKGRCPLAYDNYLLRYTPKQDSIEVYDIKSNKYLHTLCLHEPFKTIDFYVDMNLLTTNSGLGKIQFWELKEGKCVQTLYYEGEMKYTDIRNGRLAIVIDKRGMTHKREIIVWDIRTGKLLAKIIPENNYTKSVELKDDFVITGHDSDKTIIWDFQGKILFSHSKNNDVQYSMSRSFYGHLLIKQYSNTPNSIITEIMDFNNNPLSLLYPKEQKNKIFGIYYNLIKNKLQKNEDYFGCGEDAFMKKANFKDFDSNDEFRRCAIGLHALETTLKINNDTLRISIFNHLPTNLQEALKWGSWLFQGMPEKKIFSLNSLSTKKTIEEIKENGLEVISRRVKEEIKNLQNVDLKEIIDKYNLVCDEAKRLIQGCMFRSNAGIFTDREKLIHYLPEAVKNLNNEINH